MFGGPVTGRCCAMGGCFGAGCCRSGGGVGCSVGDGRAVGVDRWIVGEMDGPLLGPFFKSKKKIKFQIQRPQVRISICAIFLFTYCFYHCCNFHLNFDFSILLIDLTAWWCFVVIVDLVVVVRME